MTPTEEPRRTKPLRVLIVEDQTDDADLMVRALSQAGFVPDWVRVETAAEFRTRLAAPPDVILADYTLPRFGAREVLENLQAARLDIPVVIVTGTIGEDKAVAAMKLGAADYVLKDRMARLGQAVIQALERRRLREANRRALADLTRQRDQFKTILETLPDSVYIINRHHAVEYLNPVAEKEFGRLQEGLCYEHFHGRGDVCPGCRMAEVLAGRPVRWEWRHPRSGKTYDIIDMPIAGQDGAPAKLGILRDITVHRQAEEQRSAQAAFLESLMETIPSPVFYKDAAGRYLGCNRAFEAFLGKDREMIVGRTVWDLASPDLAAAYSEKDRELLERPGKQTYQAAVRNAAGERRHVVFNKATLTDRDGRVGGLIGVMTDVTDLRKAQEEYRRLVENINEVIFTLGPTGVVAYISPVVEEVLAYTPAEMIGRPFGEFVDPQDLAAVEVAFRETISGRSHPLDFRVRRRSGEPVWVRSSGRPVSGPDGKRGLQGVLADITRQKSAEEERDRLTRQLDQIQRMEALGVLAGGIAHDFNNILAAIIGYTQLAQDDTLTRPQIDEYLGEVLVAGNRARDLVQQILAFSRQADQELRPLRLKHVVKEALKLLRASFPANVNIVDQLESEAHVLVDPTQILQVIMNLGTNALQAMESTGGVLTVSLQGCAAPQAPFEADPTPRPWVELTVADTGAGMPPDILARIFEPFFTTKPKGLGTGMGLALAHGIVKEMQGTITVTSAPGQGSAFRIRLPVIDRQAADEAPEEETAGGGPEHIMLVDDEPAILKITARVLRGQGYAVTAHNDPHAALEALQDASQHFDLIITDVTMPGIGGEVLARAALALLPGRPVILCTGFNYRVDSEAAAALGAAAFLRKPILKKDLLATVRRVLDAYRDTGR